MTFAGSLKLLSKLMVVGDDVVNVLTSVKAVVVVGGRVSRVYTNEFVPRTLPSGSVTRKLIVCVPSAEPLSAKLVGREKVWFALTGMLT